VSSTKKIIELAAGHSYDCDRSARDAVDGERSARVNRPPGGHLSNASNDDGYTVRTQQEVADLMTARGYPMGRKSVQETERRALHKLRVALLDVAKVEFPISIAEEIDVRIGALIVTEQRLTFLQKVASGNWIREDCKAQNIHSGAKIPEPTYMWLIENKLVDCDCGDLKVTNLGHEVIRRANEEARA